MQRTLRTRSMTVVAVLAAALTLGATVAPDAARASTVTVTSAGRDGDDEASTKATTTAVGSGAGSKEGSKEESGSKESKGSFVLPDAGRGSGASCPATLNEDRKPPVDVNAVTTFTTSTPIFTSNFDAGTAAGFKQISGHWLVKDETYTQQDTCGFDYTALFTTRAVEHYRYSVTFHAKAANQGGIVFNQSSDTTRSGASVVDLTAGGTVLRWGHYDNAGYYRNDGSTPITAPGAGDPVTITVVVHGTRTAITYNGRAIATMTNPNTRGYVGLLTNQSKVAFDTVTLTGLPAI